MCGIIGVTGEPDALAVILAGLSPEAWDAPTLCQGWRVREVVAHITMPLLSATISDGLTAITIILAMSLGLIVPKIAIDRLSERAIHAKP